MGQIETERMRSVARGNSAVGDSSSEGSIPPDARSSCRLHDRESHRRFIASQIEAALRAAKATKPHSDWPRQLKDPFPVGTGVPEIPASELDAETMGGAILHHGSLIVRGLVAPPEAQEMVRDIDRAFDAFDGWAGNPAAVNRWFSPIEPPDNSEFGLMRGWNRKNGGIFAAESPALLERLRQLYHRTNIVSVIAEYLGEQPIISVGKTVLRRVDPCEPRDFHQDGAFLGRDVRTINVWIALSECGVDAPGLEIVDQRLSEIVPTGTGGAQFDWSVGRDIARTANQGRPFARPRFEAGDALFFDELMLHATSFDPGMTKTRWAVESWFFAPSACSDEQMPMSL